MATTSRTKRGTSPSNSETSSTHSQRGISSRQASTDNKEKASEKPLPNYLKPTISSLNEPLKLSKKNIISHHDQDKQKLLRRRSFDKPPSASPRGQKALISPGPRDRAGSIPAPLVPRERKLTVRSSSSSFGRHTITTTKAVADPRVSKTHKTLRSLPKEQTKTNNTFSVNKNKSSTNNASASASASRKSSSSSYEAKVQEDKEDLVKEIEEVVNKVESETSEVRSVINVPKSETEEDGNINSCNISTCTSEDQNLIQEPRIDQETDDHDHDHEQEKISKEETRSDGVIEENVIEEEAKTLKEIEEKCEDDDNNDQVEEEAESKGIKEKEGEEVSKQDDDGGAAEVVPKVLGEQEKKESPSAAYNDVIEETASKLREKRKNKVRALVGAFETVIDYESAGSPNSK